MISFFNRLFDFLFDRGAICIVIIVIAVVLALVLRSVLPCHGHFLDFQSGQYCSVCGSELYHTCDCGAKLIGSFCSSCGLPNSYLDPPEDPG